jgi:hypothetical protein
MAAPTYEHPELFTFENFELAVADPSSTNTKSLVAGHGWQDAFRRDMAAPANRGTADQYGRGRSKNPQQAQGFIGMRLVDDTAASQAEGQVRLVVRSPGGQVPVAILYQDSLSNIDLFTGAAGSGDEKEIKNREPFPNTLLGLDFSWIGNPYEVVWQIKPASDITIDVDEPETALKAHGKQKERSG